MGPMPLGDRRWGKGDEGVAPSFLTCCFLTVPGTRFSLLGLVQVGVSEGDVWGQREIELASVESLGAPSTSGC